MRVDSWIDDKILIIALVENSSALSWHTKPKTSAPSEERQVTMAIQAHLVTSIVKNIEENLGTMGFTIARQEMAMCSYSSVHGNMRRCSVWW